MTAERRFMWSERIALRTSLRMDEANTLYDQTPYRDIPIDVMVYHIKNFHAAGKDIGTLEFWDAVLKTILPQRHTVDFVLGR